MRLLLVPHAETDWNAQGKFQGHGGPGLNGRGRSQAEQLSQGMSRKLLHRILSSDLARAWQTATILAAPHGLPVQSEPRLRELHFGNWDGCTHAEVQQQDPAGLSAWQEDPLRRNPPGGESLAELTRRLLDFRRDLIDQDPQKVFLLVGHRGSMRVLLCLLLGLAVTRHWEFRLDGATVSEVLVLSEKAEVVRLNEAPTSVEGTL